jgi:hypothetical protein
MVMKLLDEREAGRASTAAKNAQNELATCMHNLDEVRGQGEWQAAFRAMQAEADAIWEKCENERKYVYGQQISSEKPEDLPEGSRPLAPIEFGLPVVDYALQFERV